MSVFNNHNQNSTEQDLRNTNIIGQRSSSGNLSRKQSSSSCLEILDGDESKHINSCNGIEKRNSSGKRHTNIGSCPPRPHSSDSCNERVSTPTKQILLQAVKRKENSDAPIEIDIDHIELNCSNQLSRDNSAIGFVGKSSVACVLEPKSKPASPKHDSNNKPKSISTDSSEKSEISDNTKSSTASDAGGDGNGEEESSDDSTEEEEERKVPNQLLMEFVTCLMEKDYQNAKKLCTMILLYEPNHKEALTFKQLIDEKIELDIESESEDDDDDEGDDDDDGDSDDDSDDDSDNDSDSSDDDDDDDDDDNAWSNSRADSGIASATSSRLF